jgi:hypothetical protein
MWWHDGGAERWRPRRREGRRRLWLTPGAVGEDERGEGGSKSKNGGGWVGLTVGGGGTATAVVRNAPGRAAVAWSPAWMRGGSLGPVRRRARERKGEESAAASGSFLKWRRRGRGGAVDTAWRAETGRREGASGAAWDSAAARQRQAAARPRRGAAWPRRAVG